MQAQRENLCLATEKTPNDEALMISESAFLKGLWQILSQTIFSNRVIKMKGQVLTMLIMTLLLTLQNSERRDLLPSLVYIRNTLEKIGTFF